jgi:hypothetical protein
VGRGKYTEGSGIGTYPVTLPESVKFEYIQLEKSINRRYVIERVEIQVVGWVSKDDKGMWLKTPADCRYLLKNRPKKNDKDAPPDVIAKLEEALKGGRTSFRIEGDASINKETTVIRLASAEPVDREEKKKP